MHAAKNHLNGIVPPASAGRYHRQMLLPGIGLQGQQRLSQSRILLVGCGALGTACPIYTRAEEMGNTPSSSTWLRRRQKLALDATVQLAELSPGRFTNVDDKL